MLISSHRHRPEDLALWAELEEADHVHGGRLLRSRKVDQSLAALREFAAVGPCYVGVSGGKDSAAAVSLLDEADLLGCVPVVFLRAVPKHNPDCPAALEALARRFPALRLEVVDYDSPVPGPLTPLETDRIATANFHRACESVGARLGRRILGVRADESRQRLLRMARWGLSTGNSCCPLGWWSLADVYGYAAVRGIPLHPAYGMLGAGRWPRDRLRVDALFGERGDGSGRASWEAEYYGDVLRRLEAGRMGQAKKQDRVEGDEQEG